MTSLLKHIQKWSCTYADGALLYYNIKPEADCQLLQEDLDALVQWAHTWQMQFNHEKWNF